MKLFKLYLAFFAVSFAGVASMAQTCNDFILFQKGATYEMETYTGKGKKESRMEYIVKEVIKSEDKIESNIQSTSYNESDKTSNPTVINLKTICQNNKLFIDLTEAIKSMQPSEMTKDMDIIVEGAMIEIPNKLTVGSTLPNLETKVRIVDKSSKSEIMAVDISTQNRKVISSESVTTPAGTFQCFKIYQEQLIAPKMLMMNMALPKHTVVSNIYFSLKEIGMVKTEIMDHKGTEVKSYTIVTKYSK